MNAPGPRTDLLGIVGEILESPPERWNALIDAACAGDEDLRTRIARLMHQSGPAAGFLEAPLIEPPDAPEPARTIAPGTIIGRYSVVRHIGSGSAAEVYEAEQEGTRRSVAVKVLRAGLSTRGSVRRFGVEIETLGGLKHPNIARLYDAGQFQTADGNRPFFAMELVRGRPLTDFARDRRLSVRERVELLIKVCDAVQYAHQNRVIHCDLKPANILVEEAEDGTSRQGSAAVLVGEPKVLDFGIARTVGPDGTLATLLATTGIAPLGSRLVGTVPYMSPEQLLNGETGVDTRSDVYSLGVIAYELLSGRLPHECKGGSIPELVRSICQDDAIPLRAIDPALPRDLGAIVAHALEKAPHNRYPTASALADDLRRWGRGEPISLAGPGIRIYVRRLWRRHPALLAALTTGLLVLGAGVALTAWQAVRATRAERLSEQRLAQLRSDADSLSGALYEKVWSLPGSTEAKRLVYQHAVDQLRALIRSGASDPETLWSYSTALMHFGETSGHPGTSNGGDEEAARALIDEAIELREQVLTSDPANPDVIMGVAESSLTRSIVGGDPQYCSVMRRRAIDLLTPLHERRPADRIVTNHLASAWLVEAEISRSEGAFEQSVKLYQEQRASGASEPKLELDMGVALRHYAEFLWERDRPRSLETLRRARQLLVAALSRMPNDFSCVRHIAFCDLTLGMASAESGKVSEAAAVLGPAIESVRAFYDRDPTNSFFRQNLAVMLIDAAEVWSVSAQNSPSEERALLSQAAVDLDEARRVILAGRPIDALNPTDRRLFDRAGDARRSLRVGAPR